MMLQSSEAPGSRPRVVHLTSVHRHDDTRIFQKECRSFAKEGWDVVFVAPGAPSGSIDGVRLHGVPRPRFRMWRLLLSPVLTLIAGLEEQGDIYHLHDPELMPVGFILKLFGKRVVFDAHEDVVGQIKSKHWLPAMLRPLAEQVVAAMNRLAAHLFDAVVVAGDDLFANFPGARLVLARNYPLLSEFDRNRRVHKAGGLLYVGGLSRTRAARELIEALRLLHGHTDTPLVVAGAFVADGSEQECRAMDGWRSVDYRGWLSRAETVDLMNESRIGIALYKAGPNHDGLRSNRVFEYMAAGLAVVGPDLPAWRKLLAEVECGVLVDPTNASAIAAGIERLLADPALTERLGQSGRRAVEAHYSWEAEFASLRAMYQELLN